MTSPAVVQRSRSFVRVAGPDAEDYLQRMLSNDIEALGEGERCEALLLTPKARIIAPVRVLRRGETDFLLSTEPELGDVLQRHLRRMRLRAQCEIEPEEHEAWQILGGAEVLDERPEGDEVADEEAERMRIEAGVPRWGRELDETVLPAEARLDETHISFTKGCYPGQEPIARQHYRGKVNRRLRVLDVEGNAEPGTDLLLDGKVVGRITSAAQGVALGYVRTEVPEETQLHLAANAGFARVRR